MRKFPVIVLFLFALFLASFSVLAEKKAENTFLRLHIRANSDSIEDRNIKLSLRNMILDYTTPLLSDVTSKNEAKTVLSENIGGLESICNGFLREFGYSYMLSLGSKTFPYKSYGKFFLPAGKYDALTVEIGDGDGKNWWCALFPAVCVSGGVKFETLTETVPAEFRLASSAVTEDTVYTFPMLGRLKFLIRYLF